MKKIFVLVFAILIANVVWGQTWQWINPIPQRYTLTNVKYIDNNTIIACGLYGIIIKSNDNGNTWSSLNTGANNSFYSMSFPSFAIGFVVGKSGVINKTTDGGNTWSLQNSGTNMNLNSVFFTDINTGYVVGDSGVILKTINGGNNWNLLNSGTFNHLTSLFFSSNNSGYIVGTGGKVLKTINGGSTWLNQNSGTTEILNSVFFINNNSGFAISGNGILLKTTNGGTNWNSYSFSNGYTFIHFSSADTGYMVGAWGKILKTTNGGSNWITQNSNVQNDFHSISFNTQNKGIIVGKNGIILKTQNDGINWNIEEEATYSEIKSITFPSQDTGYILSLDYNNVKKTINGGASWTNCPLTSIINPKTIKFANKSIGIAAGNNMFYTANGGSTWSQVYSDGGKPYYSVFFVDTNVCYAVGEDKKIAKIVNGNASALYSLIGDDYFSVYFTSLNVGYISGNNGVIMKTTNGGTNWNSLPSGTTKSLYSIFFIEPNTGFAVGDSGLILKTINAGNTWASTYLGNGDFSFISIYFKDSITGYALGEKDINTNSINLYKTINKGLTWIKQINLTSNNMNSICFKDSIGFMAGMNGNILKTNGNGGQIGNNSPICENTILTLQSPLIPGATYSWYGPNNFSSNLPNPVVSNNASLSLTGYYHLIVDINGNIVFQDSTHIIIKPLPILNGTILGQTTVCQGQNSVMYSIPLIPNATSYLWTLPSGSSGSSTTNTITINYSTNASNGNVKVRGINSCSSSSEASLTINVDFLPKFANPINGQNTVCQGQSNVKYYVNPFAYATSYEWTLPNGTSGSSTTDSIFVNYGLNSVTGNIIVKGKNLCGYGDSSFKVITINPYPSINSTIIGDSSVCQAQSNVVYSVPTNPIINSYNWLLPVGAIGTSTNNSITINYGNSATTSNISVFGVNSCGNGNNVNKLITIHPLPNSADSISGLDTVCQGQNNVLYNISPINNASSYIWTLPYGVTGTSLNNTINVDYSLSALSGNISVKGVNSCGQGISSIKAIVTNPYIGSAASILGMDSVCKGQTLINYIVSPIANATSYNWTLPVGATGTSSTNTIIIDFGSNALSGNITVNGSNSCGNGNTSTLPITISTIPLAAGTISGYSSVVAGQQNVVYSIPPVSNATSYSWDLPIGATGIYGGNTLTVDYNQTATSGNIIVYGSNSCGDGASSSLYITVNPFNPNCSAQFDMVADTTTPHHYFAVNNASGVPPLQYNWSWGDGTFSTTAYPTHTYSTSGNYKICLTIIDSVGCTTTYCDSSYLQKDPNAIISVQVIPQGTLGISSLLSDKIKIYPNPAKENLIIELTESNISQNSTISIYNIQGQLCRQIISNQPKTEVDINDLSTGLYVIKLNNEKESFVSKFVKE